MMVIKIDEIEPNVFPAVVSTDVEAKPNQPVELVLITVIEGKAVRTRVRLDRAKATVLTKQLKAALGD
jgi:hypothetical protein